VTEIEQVRKDLTRHGESISAIVTEVRHTQEELSTLRSGIESERKVRLVEDRHLNERLDRIEESIEKLDSTIIKIGMWILSAFGASLIVAISSFIFRGGLTVP
jgi:hypothetical protein